MSYSINHSLEFDITIEVERVYWENDGIGAYDYWGAKGFDKGEDYISEIKVSKFILNNNDEIIEILPEQKGLFQFFYEMIINNENFIDKVRVKEKELVEADKFESLLDQKENNRYYGE